MILTRKELDSMGCATPDCGHDHSELYVVAGCHPKHGLACKYVKARGVIVIECEECERTVATIAVARWRPADEKLADEWLMNTGHDEKGNTI